MKIGHEAHGQAIDSVADGAARNHGHAHNLKMGELGVHERGTRQ